jgi:adenine-specific DNA-methyltransferase
MNFIVPIVHLSEEDRRFAEKFIDWGVLSCLECGSETFILIRQLERIQELFIDYGGDHLEYFGFQLFPTEHELLLSCDTGLLRKSDSQKGIVGTSVLLQLLPHLLKESKQRDDESTLGYVDIPGSHVQVVSRNLAMLKALRSQLQRFQANADSRSAFFSRSASYMGSKASLAPALAEIIDTFCCAETIIVDLMCGSGAASNVFARSRKVYASDAQIFSRYLAVVQGGGMSYSRAKNIVEAVTKKSSDYYHNLPLDIKNEIDIEEYYLTTELSARDTENFVRWASDYSRVGNKLQINNTDLLAQLKLHSEPSSEAPGVLFLRYYANLFFGVRQAAEIDCLRKAIDSIDDPNDRAWALGALICATSACSDNYGGHFAQPKFDITQPLRIQASLKYTLLKRSLSVTHEFEARLLNLAEESESFEYSIDTVSGPWKRSIDAIEKLHIAKPIMVYIDPPYTREEYSRYYHVLETLVRYDYPSVSGKSSAPIKGGAGRFASEFFTRSSDQAEKIIIEIISTCLRLGWECTWSYSSSGLANVANVIRACEKLCSSVELFSADYSYKAQGKQRSKEVDEYIVVFLNRR